MPQEALTIVVSVGGRLEGSWASSLSTGQSEYLTLYPVSSGKRSGARHSRLVCAAAVPRIHGLPSRNMPLSVFCNVCPRKAILPPASPATRTPVLPSPGLCCDCPLQPYACSEAMLTRRCCDCPLQPYACSEAMLTRRCCDCPLQPYAFSEAMLTRRCCDCPLQPYAFSEAMLTRRCGTPVPLLLLACMQNCAVVVVSFKDSAPPVPQRPRRFLFQKKAATSGNLCLLEGSRGTGVEQPPAG